MATHSVKLQNGIFGEALVVQVDGSSVANAMTVAAAAYPGYTPLWALLVGGQPLNGNDGLGHDSVGAPYVTI